MVAECDDATMSASSRGNVVRLHGTMSKTPTGQQPDRLAHFEILRRLGVGGMAEVFLAKKFGAEGVVKVLVVKRILPAYGTSPRFRAMFAEEANLATRLNHPNIVQVYEFQDFGEEGQLLSMEYVEGVDLGKLMVGARTRGMLIPPWVGAYIVAEAAKGLHYAHERKNDKGGPLGIVHRDVSPQNILLSYEGAAKIADFGVATANMFRDEVGVLKGKFGYMSPEQARGERVDRRSDIYALGVILHEILSGRPLHPGLSGDDLLAAVRSGQVEPPSHYVGDVPAQLEAVVMRALSPRREERYQTARDMAGAIAMAMLQRQVLIDAATLESTIASLAGREITSPGVADNADPSRLDSVSAYAPQNTVAAIRSAKDGSSVDHAASQAGDSAAGTAGSAERLAREVRHVAIVAVRLHGLDALRDQGGGAKAAAVEHDIRQMFDQLAFKRSARFSWLADDHVRAVVGLAADPSRSASDAASLAIDIHEFLSNSSDDWPVSISASVGIARGIASGRRDRLGHLIQHKVVAPAENIASVLASQAPTTTTWVAGGIFRLVRDDFEWSDAPPVDLGESIPDNVPRTMRLHALIRPLTPEEREARRADSTSDLIGRDPERADLHSAFHQATQSTGAGTQGLVVARVIVGEMGIGKSALVDAFLYEVEGDVTLVRIDCSPANTEIPLGVVAALVRGLTGVSVEQTLDDAVGVILEAIGPGIQGANVIAFRLAELATGKSVEHFDDQDVSYVRKLVLGGIRRVVAFIARTRPLVFVVDGTQWADRASLEMLADLMSVQEAIPVLVLLVTRPDDRVAPFLEQLVHVELRGLRPDEQVRLVAARLGVQDGVASACADLIPRVGGNPFFLLEMVEALLERGSLEIQDREGRQVLVRTQQAATRGQALPSTLEQLIADRLEELPPEEREVARWLAVAGGPLSNDDIVELGRLPGPEPTARLCARGVCDRRGDMVDFRYPITRDVAYRTISAQDRVTLHGRLGLLLASSPIASGLSAVIVARHLAKGRMPSRAADLYLEAAQAARTGYQTQLASRYFQRALALLEPSDLRCLRAHEALEGICRLLGRHKERKRHLQKLRSLAAKSGNAQWVALALLRTAIFEYDENLFEKCVTACRQCSDTARIARAPHVEVESLSTMGEALRELGDLQGALAACDRALELAKNPAVAPRVRADVLRSRGLLLRRVGRVREAVDCHVEAIAVFRRVGARRPEARAMNALAFAMFVLERFEDSIALALSSISIDLAIGGRFQLAKTLSNIGQAYARLGDLPRGMAYLARAREAHERYGDQDSRTDTLLVSAEVMLEAGDADAARSFCLDAAALTSVTRSAYDEIHENIVRAQLDRMTGDPKRAIELASEARRSAEGQALVSFHCLATAVEAAARVDLGEVHTGILLATTAIGSVSAVQGSEYGLEVCCMCWEALRRASSPQADEARRVAAARATEIAGHIRDQRLQTLFLNRSIVRRVLAAAPQRTSSNPANAPIGG